MYTKLVKIDPSIKMEYVCVFNTKPWRSNSQRLIRYNGLLFSIVGNSYGEYELCIMIAKRDAPGHFRKIVTKGLFAKYLNTLLCDDIVKHDLSTLFDYVISIIHALKADNS